MFERDLFFRLSLNSVGILGHFLIGGETSQNTFKAVSFRTHIFDYYWCLQHQITAKIFVLLISLPFV